MTEFSTSNQKDIRTITETRRNLCKKTSSFNYIQPFLTETSTHLNNRKFSIFKPGSKILSLGKSSKQVNQQAKNLFYENMFMQQKLLNSKKKHEEARNNYKKKQASTLYQKLLKKLKELRRTRVKREKYLDQLIGEVKKLQKALSGKQQNEEKYLTPKEPSKYVKIVFKKKEESEKSEERNESKEKRRKTVHTMIMRRHNSIRD